MKRHLAMTFMVGVLVVSLVQAQANADTSDRSLTGRADARAAGDGGAISVESDSAGEGGGGGAATLRDCEIVTFGSGVFDSLPGFATDPLTLSEDEPLGFRRCRRVSDGSLVQTLVWWEPPVPPAAAVASEARSRLRLALPEAETSPPRGGAQLVGVPVWFWVDRSGPVTATAEVPGLSATLVATPTDTRFRISGGTGDAEADNVTLECPDGGTPWEPDRYEARAASDCSHAFDWNATYTVDATVTWSLTWTASNGESGTLPAVARTSTFTLTIEQGQAVTD